MSRGTISNSGSGFINQKLGKRMNRKQQLAKSYLAGHPRIAVAKTLRTRIPKKGTSRLHSGGTDRRS